MEAALTGTCRGDELDQPSSTYRAATHRYKSEY